jgi:hypothetical protein
MTDDLASRAAHTIDQRRRRSEAILYPLEHVARELDTLSPQMVRLIQLACCSGLPGLSPGTVLDRTQARLRLGEALHTRMAPRVGLGEPLLLDPPA